MQKYLRHKILFCMIFVSFNVYATVDPEKLIKVTPATNPNCVEYYNYKDTMYCSTTALENQAIDPHIKDYEKQTIVFDERPWQAAWGNDTPTITTVEYVPAGDDINNWSELVTSQFIPDPENKISPQQFVNMFIQGIKKAGLSPIITYIKKRQIKLFSNFKLNHHQMRFKMNYK